MECWGTEPGLAMCKASILTPGFSYPVTLAPAQAVQGSFLCLAYGRCTMGQWREEAVFWESDALHKLYLQF